MIDMYLISKFAGITPRYVAEIGVNQPSLCRMTRFIQEGVPTILVEPLVRCATNLQAEFGKYKDVSVYNCAIGDSTGTVRMYDNDQCTYIATETKSVPLQENWLDQNKLDPRMFFNVEMKTFDQIDPTTIDVLAADMEGAEWFVLNHMKSRPKIIVLETHHLHHKYINPYTDKINAWMSNNGYNKVADDNSDSLYIKV